MRHNFVLLLTAASLLLAGCVTSLHPFYTEENVIFESKLLGLWAEADGKESWLFEPAGENAYKVTYTDNEGKTGVFSGHLVNLEGTRLLDLFPDDSAGKAWPENDFYKYHLVPVHTSLKILRLDSELQMAAMDPKWMDEFLKANPTALAHSRENDRLMLTAATKELQAFVLKQMPATEAWGDPMKLVRRAGKRPTGKGD